MSLPVALQRSIARTAKNMKRSFTHLGYLNGVQNVPMPERNTVVHLAANLVRSGFAVYAEPKLKRGGRIDLIASNDKYPFVFEVKTFGRINLEKVLKDARRLKRYVPQTMPRIDGIKEKAFWDKSERWAAVLIQSFRVDFNQCWCNQMKADKTSDVKHYPGFPKLNAFLRQSKAKVGAVPVCEHIFADAHRLDLVWTAFRI